MSNINLDFNVGVGKKESRLIYNLSKRIVDIIGAVIGLILLSPILVIVGILINLGKCRGNKRKIKRAKRNVRTYV